MATPREAIPAYELYGETRLFPELMHCERIRDRAPRHGWTIRPHRHAGIHQFFLILEGASTTRIDGRDLRLERPTLLSVPRWTVHAFDFATRARGYVLSVLPETLPELFDEARAPGADLRTWSAVEADPGVDALFESIIEELGDAAVLRDAILKARAVEIAATLLRAARRAAGASASASGSVTGSVVGSGTAAGSGPGTGSAARHVERFERLIRQHVRDRWSVGDYARALALSPEHLGRVSRAVTGRTPGRLIEARTLHEARTLLAYTHRPVSRIAHELGYADPAYFARAFRRSEGVSPSGYRALRHGASEETSGGR